MIPRVVSPSRPTPNSACPSSSRRPSPTTARSDRPFSLCQRLCMPPRYPRRASRPDGVTLAETFLAPNGSVAVTESPGRIRQHRLHSRPVRSFWPRFLWAVQVVAERSGLSPSCACWAHATTTPGQMKRTVPSNRGRRCQLAVRGLVRGDRANDDPGNAGCAGSTQAQRRRLGARAPQNVEFRRPAWATTGIPVGAYRQMGHDRDKRRERGQPAFLRPQPSRSAAAAARQSVLRMGSARRCALTLRGTGLCRTTHKETRSSTGKEGRTCVTTRSEPWSSPRSRRP